MAALPGKYRRAEEEAVRFITALGRLGGRYEMLSESDAALLRITGSKEASAVKRASLDLTRALAEMRKP